ncbi:Hypothetical protein GSB_150151, partial [Giardia duodenalis]
VLFGVRCSPLGASAAPLYSAGPGGSRVNSLSFGRPGGVSNPSTCTPESGHARLLRSGCAGSEDAGQVTPPPRRSNAAPEERASRSIDQPQRLLGILHLAVAGTEGLPKILVAPTAAHQKLILLSLCVVPMVNYAPLVEITSAEADYRRFDQLIAKSFTQITNRSCDSVTDFLASRGRRRAGLLMPGFFHKELRRVWASLNVNTGARDPVDLSVEGPALREKQTYFNRLITRTHQLPDRAATHCLQMRGLRQTGACGEGEARLVLDHDMNCPKMAWTRTTRHGTIVCACTSACRGSSARSWRSDAQPSPRPEPEPDTWLIDKCKTIDGASPCPARWTTTPTRSSRSTGTGPSRSSTGRTAPSTPSPGGTSKSSMWMLKSSRSGPPSPPHTWPRRPASI